MIWILTNPWQLYTHYEENIQAMWWRQFGVITVLIVQFVFTWATPASFFIIFVVSTVNRTYNMFSVNFCWWLNLNRGPLVAEVTALPTEPQPLPYCSNLTTLQTLPPARWTSGANPFRTRHISIRASCIPGKGWCSFISKNTTII